MIDQALTLEALARGMARCLRELVLPHIRDASARIQAEELARLLDALPAAFGPQSCAQLQGRIARARALLERLAQDASPPPALPSSITRDDLAREHAELVRALEEVAEQLRRRNDAPSAAALAEVRRFFGRDLEEEIGDRARAETGLQKLSAREHRGEDEEP